MELTAGSDFRQVRWRREVFHRFYAFHCRYRAHPGAVYYVLPWLAERQGWDAEAALWFAFLNGNTQHPVTSWQLWHASGGRPDGAERMVEFWRAHYARLAFDTDRRYWKKALPQAVAGYLALVGRGTQADYWDRAAAHGFAGIWAAAVAIPTFGRLSAFSFTEYLRLSGVPFDCDTLMLEDRDGSRSHRNGLCKVLGRDDLDWHASNPGFDGRYPPEVVELLTWEAANLLADARVRAQGEPYARDVGYFTLESALCTYKSWHRPNRRYPNVYNDMFHDRLVAAERAWPGEDLDVFWASRQAHLPAHLRLEDCPGDPGCVPVKQNHYLRTGQPVMMHRDDPAFVNDFNHAVDTGALGRFREPRRVAA